MITVGETLRRERLKRNLQLEQVSRELKIAPRFLTAIEDEDFDKLPGGVFAKAFVRQYGRLLGLNEEELASQVEQVIQPAGPELPEPARIAAANIAPIQIPHMEEWQTVGDKRVRLSGSLSAAILVVIVMLLCSGIYAWLQRSHSPAQSKNAAPATTAQSSPAPSSSTQAAAKPETPAQATPGSEPAQTASGSTPVQQAPAAPPATQAAPPPAQAATPATQPAGPATPPQQDASGTPAVNAAATPAPNPDATVHVQITADEPVWILARTDGKFAFTGTMEAHQTRNLDGVKDVVLRLGNAGGVTITVNGKPIPPVGPHGQPRTIQLTSGGFQIVPARPPSEAPPAEPPIARR